MYSFKDFGIKPTDNGFEGEKIKIDRVLNKSITVYAYTIEKSKFDKGNGKCLYMQIEVDGAKRVLFTGSGRLMEMIKNDNVKLPFETTIIKQNERFEFT